MNISNVSNLSVYAGSSTVNSQESAVKNESAANDSFEESSLSDSISLSDEGEEELRSFSEDNSEKGMSIGGFLENTPKVNEKIPLKGTSEDDVWSISMKDDGSYDVSLNGEVTNYSADDVKKLVFNLGSGNNTFTADENVAIDLTINAGNGNNTITGGSGNDTIFAGKGNNNIDGGAGDDRITVGNGNNLIRGGDGADTIKVRNGNNTIFGGNGDDIITAGTGNNKIHGNDGDDIIRVSGGESTLYGDDGKDYIEGGSGNDTIYGGNDNDVIYGLGGNDKIYGGGGDDYIDGGSGDDKIYGGSGDDILSGGKGTDIVSSGAGDDIVIDDASDISESERKNSKTYELPYESDIGSSVSAATNSSANFKERIDSDITTLSALPSGRAILEGIDNSGHTVTINQKPDTYKNGTTAPVNNDNAEDVIVKPDGTPNKGTDVKIDINPSFSLDNYSEDDAPPSVVLGHELVHAYNYTTGTTLFDYTTTFNDADGTKHTDATVVAPKTSGPFSISMNAPVVNEDAAELQAVGLPMNSEDLTFTDRSIIRQSGSSDITLLHLLHSENAGFSAISYPDGTVSLNNPEGISENAIRNDLGLAPRERYGR